jgi:hypothetical protein
MREADTGEAVRMLELLLEFFGENGAHWTRGRYDDGHDRRCLIGALHHVRRKHRTSSGGAEYFLQEAMLDRRFALVYFNDRRRRSFAELRSTIVKARDLALRDAERERAAAAAERWLLAELEKGPGGEGSNRRQLRLRYLISAPPATGLPRNPACPPSFVRSCQVKTAGQA